VSTAGKYSAAVNRADFELADLPGLNPRNGLTESPNARFPKPGGMGSGKYDQAAEPAGFACPRGIAMSALPLIVLQKSFRGVGLKFSEP
jgi:hypothetical protein